jgi:hypothetical protein
MLTVFGNQALLMPFFHDTGPASETLFNDRQLSHLIDMQRGKALESINEYRTDELLNTPTDDIIERIIALCRLEVPVLLEDKAYQDTPKEMVREVRDYGRTIKQAGFQYSLTIPFTGHLGLFRHTSPLSPTDPPRAQANEAGVKLVTSGYNLTADELKRVFDGTISAIKLRLSGQNGVVTPFNDSLEPLIRKTVDERKKSILE